MTHVSEAEVVLQPGEVGAVIECLEIWWAVAGGWAIDLWLARVTGEHHEIEVSIRRGDQFILHEALSDEWNLSCVNPPSTSWRPWLRSHTIEAPAFQSRPLEKRTSSTSSSRRSTTISGCSDAMIGSADRATS
jgi:hypothetical protein